MQGVVGVLTFGMRLSPFLLWLGLLFLGFCLGIFAAWIGAKVTGSGESLSDIMRLTGASISRTAMAITLMPMVNVLLFGGLCFLAGYGLRDHQLVSNERTLIGMEIVKEYPAGNYDARTESGTIFPFNPCPDSPRLQPGFYRLIKYEQRSGCKIVRYWLPKTNPSTGEIADAQ